MCAGAVINARLDRVVYALKDAKAGAFGSVMDLNSYPLNHKPKIEYGLYGNESEILLRDFFKKRRLGTDGKLSDDCHKNVSAIKFPESEKEVKEN